MGCQCWTEVEEPYRKDEAEAWPAMHDGNDFRSQGACDRESRGWGPVWQERPACVSSSDLMCRSRLTFLCLE